MIHLDDRTHRKLWAVWSLLTIGSFAALEAMAVLDDDHETDYPQGQDTLTFVVRNTLAANPFIWFAAAGFWVWQLLHFLLQTVPWTGGGVPHQHRALSHPMETHPTYPGTED